MNNSFDCLFCNSSFPLIDDTYVSYHTCFKNSNISGKPYITSELTDLIKIEFYKCPKCNKSNIKITAIGSQFPENLEHWFFPDSKAKQFPDYVPKQIKEDYEEAFKILHISPKASATLSRRCLQGMIRNKWKITDKTLNAEINALQNIIAPDLWNAINSLRQLGNIGAHMEKDVNTIVNIDKDEAGKLIKLIEIIIKDWYIVPYERAILLEDINNINLDKQNKRKS